MSTQVVLFSGFLGINWYQPTITQTVIFIFLQVAALNLYKNITAMSSPGKYESCVEFLLKKCIIVFDIRVPHWLWPEESKKDIRTPRSVAPIGDKNCWDMKMGNKTIHTPPPPPPLHLKLGCLLFSTGNSNSGTTLHSGSGGRESFILPILS